MDSFEQALEELSEIFGVELAPDHKRSCMLVINDELRVQLEPDETEEALWMGSALFEIPPGYFRKELLLCALRANSDPYPRFGDFAYLQKKNALFLQDKIRLHGLSGEKLAEHLSAFTAKAEEWLDTFNQGSIAPDPYLNRQPTSPFPHWEVPPKK